MASLKRHWAGYAFGIGLLLLVQITCASDTSESLQQIFDSQHKWISQIKTLEATVVQQSSMENQTHPTVSTGTLIVSGEKFKITSPTDSYRTGGIRETVTWYRIYDGSQYTTIDSSDRIIGVGDRMLTDSYKSNPYGSFRIPFANFSWMHVGDEGETSIRGLQDPQLWKANRFRVEGIRDLITSEGLIRTVDFLWDHKGSTSIARATISFKEANGWFPDSFRTVSINKETSVSRLSGEGRVWDWEVVYLNDSTTRSLPMASVMTGYTESGAISSSETLRVVPRSLKINQPVDDAVFQMPDLPRGYKTVNFVTGDDVTTDPILLKEWESVYRAPLKSCLECSETTASEYLPKGKLTFDVKFTSGDSQSFEGLPYRVFYRYGDCCVLLTSGTLEEDATIRLHNLPGSADRFEYPVYLDNSLVTTLEPQSTETVSIRVGPMASQRAPQIEMTDIFTSKTTSLTNLRGKKVILDFWGVWCPPCLPSIIKLNKYAASLPDQDQVEFITLSMKPEDISPTTRFLTVNKLDSLKHCWVTNKAFSFVGQDGVPFSVFIDETGRIVWRGNLTAPDFDTQLDAFVKR